MTVAGQLFGVDTPPGFDYRDDFISVADEAGLVNHINKIAFANFEMHGVVAKRRVAFFGASYDRPSTPLRTGGEGPSPPIPAFLHGVRERLATWAGIAATDFAIIVAGLSLLSSCKMRFRPYLSPKQAERTTTRRMTTHEIMLMPRSAYIISAEARSRYEHSIPAVTDLRYSITFRTLR